MGKKRDTSRSDGSDHRLELWEQFCERFIRASKEAQKWLDCSDLEKDGPDGTTYVDEHGDSIDEDEYWDIQAERMHCSTCIVRDVLNFVWPEVESLAIKLGVPFKPDIMSMDDMDEDDDS